MSAAARPEQSMEDILASIRTIITSDGEASDAARPTTVAEALANDDERVSDMSDSGLASADNADDHTPQSELLELARIAREQGGDALSDTLLSDESRDSAAAAMATLEGTLVRNYPGSDKTLEGVVHDLLRPMLKEWLDANLPGVVERLVAREIARITDK